MWQSEGWSVFGSRAVRWLRRACCALWGYLRTARLSGLKGRNVGQGRSSIPRWMSWTAVGGVRGAADSELPGTHWYNCCKSFLLWRCRCVVPGPFTKQPVSAVNVYKPQHFCFLSEFVLRGLCLCRFVLSPIAIETTRSCLTTVCKRGFIVSLFCNTSETVVYLKSILSKYARIGVIHPAVFPLEKLLFK